MESYDISTHEDVIGTIDDAKGLRGFWKHAQDINCRKGVPMQDLDMKRFTTSNWKRAVSEG
jgi:hypothetical protein